MLKKNKRGVSQVLVTVLIIILVLGLVGIVWAVVSGVVQKGTEDIEGASSCLGISFDVSPVCDANECNVTVKRNAGGGDIGGLKVVAFDSEGVSDDIVFDSKGNLEELSSKKIEYSLSGTLRVKPSKVEVTPYLPNGNLCSTFKSDVA